MQTTTEAGPGGTADEQWLGWGRAPASTQGSGHLLQQSVICSWLQRQEQRSEPIAFRP